MEISSDTQEITLYFSVKFIIYLQLFFAFRRASQRALQTFTLLLYSLFEHRFEFKQKNDQR